jgi:hypothetical protein
MKKQRKLKDYTVDVRVTLEGKVDIQAEDLDQAMLAVDDGQVLHAAIDDHFYKGNNLLDSSGRIPFWEFRTIVRQRS